MSLNADALNFSNLGITNTLTINDKVYSTYNLEDVGTTVANTSAVNTLVAPITNNISNINNYLKDDFSSYAPYYISYDIKTDYYHFANDLSYVVVPPHTTCMIQQDLIFYYGYNVIPDPSAVSHNIYINWGCSKTILTSPPYANTSIDTSDIFSNENIIPYSYNQKLLHYRKSCKFTPINSSFFYDNVTDTSQNIYLFGCMQQYYNATPTKIIGKLVYNFIKNNTGTPFMTHNSFSTTYKNLLTVNIRGNYNSYNSTALDSITIPNNTTVMLYNAVSLKIQKLLLIDLYGRVLPLNYYFYISSSSTSIYNLNGYFPGNPSEFNTYSEVINNSMKSVQFIHNGINNNTVYLFDTNSSVYTNTTGSDVTLYLHFGITFDTRSVDISSCNIKVTGNLGKYIMTNNTIESNLNTIPSYVRYAGGISTTAVMANIYLYPKKKYLMHLWSHHYGGDTSSTTRPICTSVMYTNNFGSANSDSFYPEFNLRSLDYINRSTETFIPHKLNSTLYEGTSNTNFGATITTVGIIDMSDFISHYSAEQLMSSAVCMTGFGVHTMVSYILFELT
jgi:hypothetical protein